MKRFNEKRINKNMGTTSEYSITMHSLLDGKDYEITGTSIQEVSKRAADMQKSILKELLGVEL